ncbi:MAG: glycosyltransferase family 4 protein [candidate division WOR-3 bacterium]
MKIIYIRFQDFRKRFYISSEREIVRSFNKLNIDSELVAFGKKDDEPEFVKLFNSFKDITILIKLKIAFYLFKFRKEKVVLVFDPNSLIIFLPNYFFRKILGGQQKFVLDVRSIPVVDPTKREMMKFKHVLWAAYFFFDGLSFITEETKSICESYIKKKFRNYVVYPSGVNTEIFQSKDKSFSILKKYNLENKKIIFYHGSISKQRGLEELILSVDRLKEENRNIILFVVGSGDKEIENAIIGSGNIVLPPVKYEEVPGYISIADVCVSPLPDLIWWKGASSLKVMEYMAMGKPIVLSKIKPHIDVLPENINGYVLYDPISWENLYHAFKHFFENEEFYKKESLKLSDHVRNNFSYDIIAKKVYNFYREKLFCEER